MKDVWVEGHSFEGELAPVLVKAAAASSSRHERQDALAFQLGSSFGAAVLLDGVTSSGSLCHHGVPWFVEQLSQRCLRVAEDGQLRQALYEAVAEVRSLHPECLNDGGLSHPQSTVAIVRWNIQSVDYLVLGDSIVAFYDRRGALIEYVSDTMASRLSAATRFDLFVAQSGQPAELSVADWSVSARNSTGGFFVAADDPSVALQAIEGSIPKTEVASVYLASDGIDDLGVVDGLSDRRIAFSSSIIWSRILERLARPVAELPPDRDDITVAALSFT